ncbi:hypothetical protein [Subtercola sp. YIM 133946]|uniref:hypothetical protein n=1 Tax=Subtercola sp. YIM 133946 TaxID=3118909 RepID=UPI002F93B47A
MRQRARTPVEQQGMWRSYANGTAIVAATAFAVWYVVVILGGLVGGRLHSTDVGSLVVLGVTGYTVTLGALVLSYRARFFRWRAS